jgi:hypothetical protein
MARELETELSLRGYTCQPSWSKWGVAELA